MTPSIGEQYVQLASLTQLYLLQEYSLRERIYSEASTYAYFLENTPRPSTATKAPLPAPAKTMPAAALPPVSPASSSNTPGKLQKATERSPTSERAAASPNTPPPATEKTSLPAPETIKETKSNMAFALEAPAAYEAVDFKDIRKILSECRPGFKIVDNIPESTHVNRIGTDLKEIPSALRAIIISFDQTDSRHLAFLENLGLAIRTCEVNCKIVNAKAIEVNHGWEPLLKANGLRFIIASSDKIEAFPELKKYYSKTTQSPGHVLGSTPLILLPEISLYFKNPSLKRELWKAIQELTSRV